MDKQQAIAALAENDEDRVLLARIYDRITTAQRRNIPGATCFLSLREQAWLPRLLPGIEVTCFGGCPGAERAVCCWIPDYCEAEDYLYGEDGPVCALRARFYEGDSLSHRDFLGALMGSGIKREAVGDLYVRPGQCDLVVTREIAPYVLQSLDQAGRTKLRLEPLPLAELAPPAVQVKTIRDTVAALRLDSLVASAFGLSRSRAAQAVESGRAAVNGLPCQKPDRLVAEGDWISVRGLGKAQLTQVTGATKKGRTGVILSRCI